MPCVNFKQRPDEKGDDDEEIWSIQPGGLRGTRPFRICGWAGNRNLKALCGGESMPRDLAGALIAKVGELWNMYGPTETTIWSTLDRVVAEVARDLRSGSCKCFNRRVEGAEKWAQAHFFICK